MSRTRCFDTGQKHQFSSDRTVLRSGQEIFNTVRNDLATGTWTNTRDLRVDTAYQTLQSVSSVDLLSRITKGEYDYRQNCEDTCYGSEEAAGDAFNKTLTTDVEQSTLDLAGSPYETYTTTPTAQQRVYPFTDSATACEPYVYPPYEEVSAGEPAILRKPIYRQPTTITFA